MPRRLSSHRRPPRVSQPPLVRLVEVEEFDIRKEAAYALCNACIGAAAQTVSGLVYLGVLPALTSLLDCAEPELILSVCDALMAALEAGAASSGAAPNPVPALIEEAGGCEKLEALQMHENTAVYQKAALLIDSYFADETEDAAIAPTATADGFQFGIR